MMSPIQACSASRPSCLAQTCAFSAGLEKFQLGSGNLHLNSPKKKKKTLDSLKLKCQRSARFCYEPFFSWTLMQLQKFFKLTVPIQGMVHLGIINSLWLNC